MILLASFRQVHRGTQDTCNHQPTLHYTQDKRYNPHDSQHQTRQHHLVMVAWRLKTKTLSNPKSFSTTNNQQSITYNPQATYYLAPLQTVLLP
ncbi:hypothetical protein [Candidatus Bathycorpusculum sp.]|uniref:hypothetical protein n=1 Tax=Candidatus Bathycorpusculum sp. TaxID=2994959 RepID=UPI00281D38AE|nr:hypothetical protein [Candidatus Termitimicrobium sp.]MCL2432758.1 hypothetical protein [Candidatus Termitimicrobium sp.]